MSENDDKVSNHKQSLIVFKESTTTIINKMVLNNF